METDRIRILAVDDDPDILELFKITLSPGYDVITLQDSMIACELLDIVEPDLVILDIMMPKITGYHLAELVRERPKLQHTLIVFLSAKDSSRDVRYGYKLGASLYITKPFQPERLLKNLDILVQPLMGKVRKKTYSVRDVSLRIQMMGSQHSLVTGNAGDQAVQGEATPSGSRLRRPLGHEADEVEQKKWVD